MAPRIYPSQQNTNANATGKVIFSLDEYLTIGTSDYLQISDLDTGRDLKITYLDVSGNYATNIMIGGRYEIALRGQPFGQNIREINLYRRDYTTDDVAGNNGIIDSYITNVTGSTGTLTALQFTASTINNSTYNFEYRVIAKTLPKP